jgi:hypothetical protein
MSLSDLQVFSDFVYSTSTEMLDQQINLFNQATAGGITLRTASNLGDFSESAHWKKISGLVRRRNAYGSGAVTAKTMEHLLETSVKVAAGTPPVEIDPGMLRWIQKSPEEAGVIIGQQMAGDTMADMLNTALLVYVNAIGQVAAVIHDGTAATANLSALNRGAAKFGDRSQDINTWVMHSTNLHDIYGESLANSARLFQFGDVRVIEDGFGRPLVQTDSPSLITSGSPDTYHICGLTQGAVMVEQNGDFDANIETSNGDENILRTYQAEWSYNVGLKGFAWDKANGGKSPNDTALGTATNWDRYATSDKDLAGVLVNTQ